MLSLVEAGPGVRILGEDSTLHVALAYEKTEIDRGRLMDVMKAHVLAGAGCGIGAQIASSHGPLDVAIVTRYPEVTE